MPAIYQPLRGGELLRRLGYAQGRFILENGRFKEGYTQDWAERMLQAAQAAGSEFVSDDEIAQMRAAAKSAGMAASMSAIRERVSRLAADLPQDLDMGAWGYEACTKPDCPPIPHGRITKTDEGSEPVSTFEVAFAFCWAVVEEQQMTTDQAVRLLHQAGELPLDRADYDRRWEAIPEAKRREIASERMKELAEQLGGAVLLDQEGPEGRATMIGAGLTPEMIAVLQGLFGARGRKE
ncbi:MAG: hypothetical protein HY437_01570 [Candidatus Magasanikbacteria bacterium]|nr:hypothetical protein [Candidatus Magasanikbacteria bacterium]